MLPIVRGRSGVGFAGAVVSMPFPWYLSGYRSGVFYSPMLLAGNVAAAYLLHRGRWKLAALCLVPFLLIVIQLAITMFAQK